jgi:hypothetical protein
MPSKFEHKILILHLISLPFSITAMLKPTIYYFQMKRLYVKIKKIHVIGRLTNMYEKSGNHLNMPHGKTCQLYD